jgi:phytol kinase
MGIIALPFPWIFRDSRPVWVLAGLSIGILCSVRLVPNLAGRFGGVLGGVGRTSLGDLFFPVGMAGAFTLAHGNAAAFCAAAGVLAFADTAGALVGTRWGRLHYSLFGNQKSLEGSAGVFLVASIWVAAVPVALGTKALVPNLAAGLFTGLIATLAEALSIWGLDNLLLPIVVVTLMRR